MNHAPMTVNAVSPEPIKPHRVEIGEFGVINIYLKDGSRLQYAVDRSGVMTLGQVIRYPWTLRNGSEHQAVPCIHRHSPDTIAIAMFVPVAPYAVPWVLDVDG